MAYQTYTLAQVRVMLQDKVEGVPFWSATEADTAINEALLVWNSLTGFWKDSQTITTTPNSWSYSLSTTIVFGTRVEYQGKALAQASLADMDWGHPGWQSETTADGGNVPNTPRKWLPLSIDMIAIWPADAAGGHTLLVDGISQTPRLAADGDYINIGPEELNALLGYSLHVLALKEGGARFATTMGYFKQFLSEAAEENGQLLDSAIFREFLGIDQSRKMVITRGLPNDYDSLGGK